MRKGVKAEDYGVNLGIIITPMLDMSFQILAFFIMTYNPSALEGHIDGTLLPPTNVALMGKDQKMDLPSVDTEPELTDVLMVVVKAVPRGQKEGERKEGEPSRILLKLPEASTPDTVVESDSLVDTERFMKDGLKKLAAVLKKHTSDPTASKANIKLEPDGDLRHQYTMMVYDACKKAGFKNVSFVAPPPERGGGE